MAQAKAPPVTEAVRDAKMWGSVVALAAVLPFAAPFYLPGVAPRTFRYGDKVGPRLMCSLLSARAPRAELRIPRPQVELKVNKLTSVHTQIPFDYYTLKFCRPKGGIKHVRRRRGAGKRGAGCGRAVRRRAPL